jgi:hypothetical protein
VALQLIVAEYQRLAEVVLRADVTTIDGEPIPALLVEVVVILSLQQEIQGVVQVFAEADNAVVLMIVVEYQGVVEVVLIQHVVVLRR